MVGHLIGFKGIYPYIFGTSCLVHNFRIIALHLKNVVRATKNNDASNVTYDECSWIKDVIIDAQFIKNFIKNNLMRLAMCNEFTDLKFLTIVETNFANIIVMFKRFVQIKQAL